MHAMECLFASKSGITGRVVEVARVTDLLKFAETCQHAAPRFSWILLSVPSTVLPSSSILEVLSLWDQLH